MKRVQWIMVFILSSCSLKENLDYCNIDGIRFISWIDVFSHTESGYFYFFSRNCTSCNKIKGEVLSFLIEQRDYFLIEKDKDFKFTNDISSIYGVNNISEFAILGYPTLVFLENYVVTYIFSGVNEIRNHI